MAVEKTPNVPPFVSYCAQLIPTVFDNSLSYYEALAALAKWMQDNLVDVINNNATVTEQYIAMTEALKSYVENYFDNLDVQEEINNKLDDMVEQGTLQEIITSYIQANVAWTFDTVADMKQSENLIAGSYAQTLGFHSINDGGGATYYITDTGTANEMNVIAVGSLYANLVTNGIKNIRQFGCYGDNTHDDKNIIKSIIENASDGDVIYIPKGQYLCTTDISATANDIRIYGDNQNSSTINFNDDGSIVFNGHGIKLSDLRFTHQDKVELDSYHNTLNNVNIDNGALGLVLKNAYITEVENCYFTYNTVGVILDNQSYEVIVSSSVIDNNKLGVLVTGTSGCKFIGCTIEGNRDTSSNRGCGFAHSSSNTDIQIDKCWFESNGTTSDSVDIMAVADIYDSTFSTLVSDIHSYYAFTNSSCPGNMILSGNHHLFTQYAVVMGGYLNNTVVENCTFKGTLDKNNMPILIMHRSNVIRYNTLKARNNKVINTDNQTITTQMLNGIKGSYIYTNAVLTNADFPSLLTTDYYELDGQPLFVYMPMVKNLSNIKYLHQYQSGGTSYDSGIFNNHVTNSYSTSGTLYINDDGTTQGGTDIFDSTGETTFSVIEAYGSSIVFRRDNNVADIITPLAEGYMRIRTADIYSQKIFAQTPGNVTFALVQFNADEIKASKQCIAMKPLDLQFSLFK